MYIDAREKECEYIIFQRAFDTITSIVFKLESLVYLLKLIFLPYSCEDCSNQVRISKVAIEKLILAGLHYRSRTNEADTLEMKRETK